VCRECVGAECRDLLLLRRRSEPLYEVENLRIAIGVDGGNPCRVVANKFCDRTSDASDFMGIGFRSWKFARGAAFFK